MAMSGTVVSNKIASNYQLVIDWSIYYNVESMTADLSLHPYIRQDPLDSSHNYTYRIYGTYETNYIKYNDEVIFTTTKDQGNGTYNNPFHGFTKIQNPYKEQVRQLWWMYPDGHYANAWVYLAADFTYFSKTLPINNDGYCTFDLSANLDCFGGTMVISRTTINTTPTEVSSKIGYKTGGSWTGNGRIWHKENGTWVKKFLYRKESGSWNKK